MDWIFGLLLILSFFLQCCGLGNYSLRFRLKHILSHLIIPDKYLIDTPTCRIPDINPFEDEAMEMFKNYYKYHCFQTPQMVTLIRDNHTLQYSLRVDPDEALKLNVKHPHCCMKIVTRKHNSDAGYE